MVLFLVVVPGDDHMTLYESTLLQLLRVEKKSESCHSSNYTMYE